MRITIDVRLDTEPGDNQQHMYGTMNFSENAQLTNAGFETASKVFSRCHDLLAALKIEHSQSAPGRGGK